MSLPIPLTTSQNMAANDDDHHHHHFDRDCERLYIELVQKSRGDLRQLLSSFFSFLHRRTDLYCVTDGNNDKNTSDNNDTAPRKNMGFREGEAEKIIIAAFRQFPLRRVASPLSSSSPPPIQSPPPPSTASSQLKMNDTNSTTKIPVTTAAITTTATTTSSSTTGTSGPTLKSNRNDLDDVEEEMKYTEDGLQIPIGNGGIVPHKYRWTQTLEECTILLPCPNNVHHNSKPLRGKDVRVTMLPQTLRVQIIINPSVTATISDDVTSKSDEGTFVLLLDGTLAQKIVPSESTWTMESGVLQIILYKSIRTFWECIFLDDTIKIDTSLVDSRRNIDTYDDVTQAHIRKIIHEQQQQSMGLPTSDDSIVTSSDGDKPRIPSVLPKGVEYIDQAILDSKMKELGK